MRKKNSSCESVLDAKHMINQGILLVVKMFVAGIGIGVTACLLYVPGWYSFTWAMITLLVTVIILAILVFLVDNLNVNSQDGDRIRRINRQLLRESSRRSIVQMSYEELTEAGRSLSDEKDE